MVVEPYRAPAWLAGAHAQTVWPALLCPRPEVAYRRERWDTPDCDFIDLDWAGPELSVAPALVVLFHGLEGSSQSHYARALMAHTAAQGLAGVVVHFRGCGGELNRLARAYHSGDSAEIDWILRRLRAAMPEQAALFAVGVSLGGNVLLKWLGEQGESAAFVAAAAAFCPPQSLQAGAIALQRGFSRLYARNFLVSLKRKSLQLASRFPGLLDASRVRSARDFFDFDEHVTARLHGFRSAIDYWQRCSCRQFLGGIEVPTLIVNALNDPFLPAQFLAQPHEVSARVSLDYPATGGHVGFARGPLPGRLDWLPQRVFAHFNQQANLHPPGAARPSDRLPGALNAA
ncbi:MAG: YheT family hydrolase [Burkholderiales bacterium]